VPDDERTRRRLGDATKARIEDLAAGWAVDSDSKVEPEPLPAAPLATPDATPTSAPEPRARRKTQPPPPPGSVARKQLEQQILDTSDTIDEDANRSDVKPRGEMILATSRLPKLPTQPPPIPARAKTASAPPLPKLVIEPAVPQGEFDPTGSRYGAHAATGTPALKPDDSASATHPRRGEPKRGDGTSVATSPFERADPTNVSRDDETAVQAPSPARLETVGGTLRVSSALRRKRGIGGDVRYVFTALFGIRRARRELASQTDKQKSRQSERKRHLTTLGRSAVSADAFDHPALGRTRESLSTVEDERSKHAGAVAASDSELERVRREREATHEQHATGIAAALVELAELAKKLEPLEREASAARKKAATLADQLRKIARNIAETEALLVSVKSEKMDRAGIQADIATLKADQKAVQRDEPMIAAELDALEPRIAEIKAKQADAERTKTEHEAAEADDQRRTTELFEAIGAKHKVVARAAADAEAARDRVLFELGERLYVDRPASLTAQLAPIDRIDLELGESDRRAMELREILANVDRLKIARGIAVMVLTFAAAGGFVAWLLVMLL
jgi:hypothetical protein